VLWFACYGSGDSGGRSWHSREADVLRPQGSDNCSGCTDPALRCQRAQQPLCSPGSVRLLLYSLDVVLCETRYHAAERYAPPPCQWQFDRGISMVQPAGECF